MNSFEFAIKPSLVLLKIICIGGSTVNWIKNAFISLFDVDEQLLLLGQKSHQNKRKCVTLYHE